MNKKLKSKIKYVHQLNYHLIRSVNIIEPTLEAKIKYVHQLKNHLIDVNQLKNHLIKVLKLNLINRRGSK